MNEIELKNDPDIQKKVSEIKKIRQLQEMLTEINNYLGGNSTHGIALMFMMSDLATKEIALLKEISDKWNGIAEIKKIEDFLKVLYNLNEYIGNESDYGVQIMFMCSHLSGKCNALIKEVPSKRIG